MSPILSSRQTRAFLHRNPICFHWCRVNRRRRLRALIRRFHRSSRGDRGEEIERVRGFFRRVFAHRESSVGGVSTASVSAVHSIQFNDNQVKRDSWIVSVVCVCVCVCVCAVTKKKKKKKALQRKNINPDGSRRHQCRRRGRRRWYNRCIARRARRRDAPRALRFRERRLEGSLKAWIKRPKRS